MIRPILVSLALLLGNAMPAQGSVDPCAKLEKHFRQHGLPVKEFTYIAKRESGCNPKAINARFNKKGEVIWTLNKNGSIDRGLLQINSVHKQTVRSLCRGGLDLLLELDCNLKVGSYLYKRYGLVPWKAVSSSVKD